MDQQTEEPILNIPTQPAQQTLITTRYGTSGTLDRIQPIGSARTTSGAQAQAQNTWTTPGVYEVKVKAKDQNQYESDWSSVLPVTITDLKPLITIGTINGGLLAVTSSIKNIGEASATNIKWKITIDGDFMVSGLSMSGTLTSLGVNNLATIENAPVLGFGSAIITVTVSADGVSEVAKTVNGFVFFIFVIV